MVYWLYLNHADITKGLLKLMWTALYCDGWNRFIFLWLPQPFHFCKKHLTNPWMCARQDSLSHMEQHTLTFRLTYLKHCRYSLQLMKMLNELAKVELICFILQLRNDYLIQVSMKRMSRWFTIVVFPLKNWDISCIIQPEFCFPVYFCILDM